MAERSHCAKAAMMTWWWNGKDYLKKRAKAVGQSPQMIEDMVNNDRALAICADLANARSTAGSTRRTSRTPPRTQPSRR